MSVRKHRPARAKVTILCTRNDQVLLVRRKGAKWKFPGGLLETGEAPIVVAARALWHALSLHCCGLNEVGTIEVGNVLHHVFTADFAEGCSVSLGSGIAACKWVGWQDLSSTMLQPTAAALLSRDLSALAHGDQLAASQLASNLD